MLGRAVVRRLSSLAEPLPKITHGSYRVPNSTGYKKLMERQNLFCREDGTMVWQKSGGDSILYNGTIVFAVVGTILNVGVLWKLISPPKN